MRTRASFLLPLLVAYGLGFFCRLAPKIVAAYAVATFALGIVPVLVTDWGPGSSTTPGCSSPVRPDSSR